MYVPIRLDAVPTPGALLGTSGSAELIANINSRLGLVSDYFGSVHDVFSRGRQAFVRNIVEPIRQVGLQVRQAANKFVKNDVYIPLVDRKDFEEYIPPCMQMPILMHEPVRRLHEQGRISGFGIAPEALPEEDAYGRLINNGVVEDLASAMDKNGEFTVYWEYDTMDPDLSHQDLDYIEQTRDAITAMLGGSDRWDPTNPFEEIG